MQRSPRILLSQTLADYSDEYLISVTEERLIDPDSNGCRVWPGRLNKKGYARVNIRGKIYMVNRVIWYLHHGEPGDEILHMCDNPPCGEISHLRTGTSAENAADKMAKGRYGPSRAGENNGKAILTESQVAIIKGLKGKIPYKVIAEEYGVSLGCIKLIMCGRNWSNVNPKL